MTFDKGVHMTLTLAADMDGVLADLMGYTETMAKAEGIEFDWSTITSHGFLYDYNIPSKVRNFVRDLWSRESTWLNLPPLPLVGILNEFCATSPSTELYIMTSPWTVDRKLGMCADAKRVWLEAQDIYPHGILFTTRDLTRRGEQPPKHVIDADIYYEDHPDIAVAIAEAHPKSLVIVPKRRWNSQPEHLVGYVSYPNIHHWNDAEQPIDLEPASVFHEKEKNVCG